jgi:hypothetical protein
MRMTQFRWFGAMVGIALAGIVAAPSAWAAPIYLFDFDESTATPSPNPASTDPNLTGTVITHNPANGGNAFEIANTYGYPTGYVLRMFPAANAIDAASAVANNSYFTFTITPNVGEELDLSSLTFNVARGGGGGTPRGYAVRTSVDAFAANVTQADVGTVRPTWTSVTADLSGPAYQHLTTGTTFNLYMYAPSTGSSMEFDSITVNGTVAAVVPEPATGLLLGLGGLLLRSRRARR